MANPSHHLTQELSDKIYWHGYIQFYEPFFQNKLIRNIAEFGVFQGNSIRWLLKRFPEAIIHGADIVQIQSNWPIDPRFHFTQLDQDSTEQVSKFVHLEKFDLIIEDGSHHPKHQIICLIEGMKALNPGGIYILEDIQTSRAEHPWWHKKFHPWKFKLKTQFQKLLKEQQLDKGNALHALLALDHYKRIGQVLDQETILKIAQSSMLTPEDIKILGDSIKEIHLYQRSNLPDFCHQCGSKHYSFSKFRCVCGAEIFSDNDSMSFVMIKNPSQE